MKSNLVCDDSLENPGGLSGKGKGVNGLPVTSSDCLSRVVPLSRARSESTRAILPTSASPVARLTSEASRPGLFWYEGTYMALTLVKSFS